jgi:hypothetical protein
MRQTKEFLILSLLVILFVILCSSAIAMIGSIIAFIWTVDFFYIKVFSTALISAITSWTLAIIITKEWHFKHY